MYLIYEKYIRYLLLGNIHNDFRLKKKKKKKMDTRATHGMFIIFTPKQHRNTPPGTLFKKNIYLTHFTIVSPEILRFKNVHFYNGEKKILNDRANLHTFLPL